MKPNVKVEDILDVDGVVEEFKFSHERLLKL
jgi:hypothetical protein